MQYDERQKFEHELINRRLTWLLTSQTILFAALALIYANESSKYDKLFFTIIISGLGFVISVLIFIGVFMGIRAKRKDFENELYKQKTNQPQIFERDPIEWGVETKITKIATIPDLCMPIAFALAWKIIFLWKLLRVFFS